MLIYIYIASYSSSLASSLFLYNFFGHCFAIFVLLLHLNILLQSIYLHALLISMCPLEGEPQ